MSDATLRVQAPDTLNDADALIDVSPLNVRAPELEVVAEAAIALSTRRMTPAVHEVVEVVEMALEANLTRWPATTVEDVAGPKLAAFSRSAVE